MTESFLNDLPRPWVSFDTIFYQSLASGPSLLRHLNTHRIPSWCTTGYLTLALVLCWRESSIQAVDRMWYDYFWLESTAWRRRHFDSLDPGIWSTGRRMDMLPNGSTTGSDPSAFLSASKWQTSRSWLLCGGRYRWFCDLPNQLIYKTGEHSTRVGA